MHEREAKERGFMEEEDEDGVKAEADEEEQTGSELAADDGAESDLMAELRNKFPNMNVFNNDGM